MNTAIKPQNFAEWAIGYAIVLTYPLYLLGLVFPVNTALPWLLFLPLGMGLPHPAERAINQRIRIPMIVWVWVWAVGTLLLGLFIGATTFVDDPAAIGRSLLNWSREWALFPICLLLGSRLPIRPQIIYRAVCYLCGQSMLVLGICVLAFMAQVPHGPHESLISHMIQHDKLFYAIQLYLFDVDSRSLHFTLFAPWTSALGVIGCIYFLLALQEPHKVWRSVGLVGATAMILASLPQDAAILLPVALLLVSIWGTWNRVYIQLVTGFLVFWLGLFSMTVTYAVGSTIDGLPGVHPSAARLQWMLQQQALAGWAEAPLWGHGQMVSLPNVLPEVSLSLQQTWFSLLFSHGLVGGLVVFIAIVTTLMVLAIRSQVDPIARVALGIMLIVFFTAIGQNMEKLTYLFWPALVLIGCVFRSRRSVAMW
jgi:hypothetical protein